MFAVLVRARGRMALNTAQTAPPWQRGALVVLGGGGLALFGVIAAACAALVVLTQNGARALTPATHSLVGHVFEYVFFFLLAGSVPFVAATLFQAGDLPLLLTTPAPPRALVAAKLLDAALANAGPSAALGIPALVGIGTALALSVWQWLGLALALLLLLLLTPAATALLLLLAARALGMRRVRVAVTVISLILGLGITLLAVVGASQAARLGLLDPVHLQAAAQGEVAPSSTLALARNDPAPAWLPSAWAAATVETSNGVPGLLALTALTTALVVGCLAVGPSVLASEAFLEPDAGVGLRQSRAGRPVLRGLSLPVAGLVWKDLKYVARDLILQGQIGTALILFLVPFLLKVVGGGGSADADLYGDSALALLLVIVYMVTSIISLTSVGLEGRGGWMTLAAPISRGLFLRAKWLLAGGLSWGIVLVLTLIAWPAFALSGMLTLEALAVYFCACFALSGLGVGLAGLFPRFVYENPAHRASVVALTLGFVLATTYLIIGGLIAALAWLGVTRGGLPVGAVLTLAVSAFVLLSLLTGLVPVALAARRLRDYEWEQ